MAFQIYHDRAAILAGFFLVTALFSTAFIFGEDNTSLTGYVVMDHGQRISTAKMDAALVQEIAQGNTTPRVIVLLEEEEDLLTDESQAEKSQNAFLGELEYKVDVVDQNETQQHQEADFILNKQFENTNAIAGQIQSGDALLEITKSSKVKKIVLDYPVQVTLDESAARIAAPLAWQSNYTGSGLSTCVIDTGIAYDHPAFGSCLAKSFVESGNARNIEIVESPHPYQNNVVQTFTVTQPGFENIALHFVNLSLEQIGQADTLDRVYILDTNDNIVAIYKGVREDFWTPHVQGDTIKVQLVSDSSITSYGFYIDQALNGTTNTTIDWTNCSAVIGGYDTFNDDTDPYDGQGHGTHVAGIIASRDQTFRGIAPSSTLAVVKALSDQGMGYGSDIVAGLEWCISNAKQFNITVISMSLGCSGGSCPHYQSHCQNDITAPLVAKAVSQNISVVIASGNDGWSDGISNPSCVEGATPVGAVNDDDQVIFNRGNLLDLVAPGFTISAPYLENGFSSLSGTSMATPHVSGALLLAYQYSLNNNLSTTPASLRQLLINNGKQVYDQSANKNFSRVDLDGLFALEQQEEPNVSSTFILHSPQNNSYHNDGVALNLTATNTSNISITLANNSYVTNSSFFEEINLHDGSYNVTVIATNLDQPQETHQVFFIVDSIAPSLEVEHTNLSNTYNLSVNVSDEYVDTIIFASNMTGNWENTTLERNQSYTHSFTIDSTTAFYVMATDHAGNVNQSQTVSLHAIQEEHQQEQIENITIILPSNNSSHEEDLISFLANYNGTWQFADENITNKSYSKQFVPGNYTVFFRALNQTRNVSFIVEVPNPVPRVLDLSFIPEVHRQRDKDQTFSVRVDDTNFLSASLDLAGHSVENSCAYVENHYHCAWNFSSYNDGLNGFRITARDQGGKLNSVSGTFLGTSCSDRKQNGDEEGVDCSGSCNSTCEQPAVQAQEEVQVVPDEEQVEPEFETQQVEQVQEVAAASSEQEAQETSTPQEEAKSTASSSESRSAVESELKEEEQTMKTHALYGLWAFIALIGIVYALFVRRK